MCSQLANKPHEMLLKHHLLTFADVCDFRVEMDTGTEVIQTTWCNLKSADAEQGNEDWQDVAQEEVWHQEPNLMTGDWVSGKYYNEDDYRFFKKNKSTTFSQE